LITGTFAMRPVPYHVFPSRQAEKTRQTLDALGENAFGRVTGKAGKTIVPTG
jgi:hypothetical protein